jgi:ribosome silencing factor RsfS/YbeB/iojap
VDVLRREKARKLTVIRIPKELKYVDYLCLVNGISYRHMLGMAEFVRKCYKMKRHTGEIIPKLEGENCKSWIALDLGNIALHIFADHSRRYYDLESLWCLGEEYENRIKNRNTKDIYQMYIDQATATDQPASTNFEMEKPESLEPKTDQ